jgi:hypothetical protein
MPNLVRLLSFFLIGDSSALSLAPCARTRRALWLRRHPLRAPNRPNYPF